MSRVFCPLLKEVGEKVAPLEVEAVVVEVEALLVEVNNINFLLAILSVVVVSLDNRHQVLVAFQLLLIFHLLVVYLHRPLEF